jgi:predicted DNA-binding transcriptional regulator AlpA
MHNVDRASEQTVIEIQQVTPLEHLLTEHDVAFFVGVSVASVRRWRTLGTGPAYLKIGSAVRYKPSDVAGWLDAQQARGSNLMEARS